MQLHVDDGEQRVRHARTGSDVFIEPDVVLCHVVRKGEALREALRYKAAAPRALGIAAWNESRLRPQRVGVARKGCQCMRLVAARHL